MKRLSRKLFFRLVFFGLVMVFCFNSVSYSPTTASITPLMQKAQEQGRIRVMVSLESPEQIRPFAKMSSHQRKERTNKIHRIQDEVASEVIEKDGRVVSKFNTVSAIALEVTPEALENLQRNPQVKNIYEERIFKPLLENSVETIGAKVMHEDGYSGEDQIIAVIDTGVDTMHPVFDYGERVEHEACFTDGDCPDGSDTMIGPGAAAPVLNSDSEPDFHGTHVAGIALGEAASGLDIDTGVTPGARLIAVNIFSKGPDGPETTTSKFIKAVDYITELASDTYSDSIAALNVSIGITDAHYSSVCDDADDLKDLADAFKNLTDLGVVTAAASGNQSWENGIAAPACFSSVTAVGAVNNENIWTGSNRHPDLVDFVTPGVNIKSATPNSGGSSASGTSMSAPHLAGSFALLRSAISEEKPDLLNQYPAAFEEAFLETGELIIDDETGAEYCLPKVYKALNYLWDTYAVIPTADRAGEVYSWPNPFRLSRDQTVKFSIPTDYGNNVSLEIYNLRGRRVFSEKLQVPEVDKIIKWQPEDLASGTYIYLIVGTAGQTSSDNITVIR